MKQTLFFIAFAISGLICKSQVVANFSANPTVICPGQSVQFTDLSTGNPTIWNWTFPGGSPATSTLQNPVVTYSFAGSYNVSLSASNGGIPGTNTTFSYITVNPAPLPPPVISGPLTVCQGQPASYSVAPVSNAFTYSWTVPSSATILSGQGSNSITLVMNGPSSTLCVSAGNSCGYGASTCSVIVSLAAPVLTVTPATSTICAGRSVTLTAAGAATYTWSPPAGLNTVNGSSVVASPSATTVYTVTGSAITGCTAMTTATVNVLPAPNVIVTPSSAVICSGGSVSLVASGASTYSWSPGSGLNTTSGATVVASPTTTTSYTVTGTSGSGCSNTAVATITVTSAPPTAPGPVAGSPVTCIGLTGTFAVIPVTNSSTYSWTVPPGASILSGQGTTSILVSFGATGGSVCVKAGNGCGYGPSSCLVIVPLAQPTVIVIPASSTICAGATVTLSASGAASYSWSPSTGLNNTNTSTVAASPSASIIYTVTGTSGAGCSNTATASIVVNSPPSVSISPEKPSICGNSSVTLTASGGISYTWGPGASLSSTNGAVVVASPSVTTSYTVTGSSASGCTQTAAVTVTVTNSPPVVSGAPAGPTVICSGDTAIYSITPALNASSYSWTIPSGASILAGQGTTMVSVQFGNNSGNICVSGINSCGMGTAFCKSVTVNPSPAINVSPPSATICEGSFVALSASGAVSYSWTPSNGVNSTTLSTIVAGPFSTTVYTVTGTSSNGCTGRATATVVVNPLPLITVSSSAPSICFGGNATLTASGGASYTWSPSSSLNTTSGATVVADPTITTTYTVAGTSNSGCQNMATITLTVYSSPPAGIGAISGPTLVCENSVSNFSILPVIGADSYSWNVPAGSAVLSGQGSTVIGFNAGSTSGDICVTAINGCGSSATTCISITISPNPTVSVTSSGPSCSGTSVTLTASGAAGYTWSPAQGLSSTTGATVTASSPGVYMLTGANSSGCTDSQTVEAVFISAPDAPLLTGPAEACKGSILTFSNNDQPGVTYSWTVSPGGIEILSQTSSSMGIIAGQAGTVCISGQNECGSGPASCKSFSLKPSPEVTISTTGKITCSANNIMVTAISSSESHAYLWSGPGAFTFTGKSFNAVTPGTYSLQVTDTVSECSAVTLLAVLASTTSPLFTASITASDCFETISRDNGAISLTAAEQNNRFALTKGSAPINTDYNSASIIPANGIITNTLANPPEDQPYTLRIINEDGCYTDTVLTLAAVNCDDGIFIPQAFTPEGDGKNDLFVISGLPSGGNNALTVFNRWGNKVFYQSDYDNTWDGRANVAGMNTGQRLPPGTYYYILDPEGRDLKPITGYVVLQY